MRRGKARLGKVGRGRARLGMARQGKDRHVIRESHVVTNQGRAWRGIARLGKARHGTAGRGRFTRLFH